MKSLKLLLPVLLLIAVSVTFAQESKLIEYGDVVESVYNGETLEYQFEAEAGDWVMITLESEDFDAMLGIKDPSGEEFARDDDGGMDQNARLTLSLSESGIYTILARSFGSGSKGDFVLRLDLVPVTELAYNEIFEGEFKQEREKFFVFDAGVGDTINIKVTTQERDSIDTRLTLKRPDGSDATTDDDTGANFDPYIRRYTIQDSGRYTIQLDLLAGEPVEGPFSIVVEKTDMLALSSTPIAVTITEELSVENMVYDVEAAGVYRLMVDPVDASASFSVDFSQAEGSVGYASATSTRLVLDFEVPSTGLLTVRLYSYVTRDTDFKVSIMPAE